MTSKTRELGVRRIAVCVCSSDNESGSLTECLGAIGSQIVPPEIHPLIIVVDSQTGSERKRDIEGFKGHSPYDIVYIQEEFANEAAAKNKAIEAALERSADWVVFLEHHLAIEPDWLVNIVYPNYHRVEVTQGEALDTYEGESLCYFLGTQLDEGADGQARTAIYVRYSADILRKGLRFTDDKGGTWADISSVLQWINKASPIMTMHAPEGSLADLERRLAEARAGLEFYADGGTDEGASARVVLESLDDSQI